LGSTPRPAISPRSLMLAPCTNCIPPHYRTMKYVGDAAGFRQTFMDGSDDRSSAGLVGHRARNHGEDNG
jgi:hypothetical protein